MSTVTFASASTFRLSPRRPLTVMALFGLLVLGLGVAFPGHALDLVGFVGIAGQMTSTVAQIAALGPSIKALVGFVGFVAPHVMRRLVGNDQRVLLPASALGGAVLVLLADTVARTAVAPLQLPVGVLTALIGVPGFISLVRRL